MESRSLQSRTDPVRRLGPFSSPGNSHSLGSTLVVNRDLEAGDSVALHVWVRRLADVVGGSPTVDLTRVQQIDSRCIGILTELWVTCTQRGQPPTFEVSPAVHERLRGLNLDRVFTIRESSPRASS